MQDLFKKFWRFVYNTLHNKKQPSSRLFQLSARTPLLMKTFVSEYCWLKEMESISVKSVESNDFFSQKNHKMKKKLKNVLYMSSVHPVQGSQFHFAYSIVATYVEYSSFKKLCLRKVVDTTIRFSER